MASDNPFQSPDFTKLFERMSMPGMDMSALMALQQKNMEALQLANKTMLDGFQTVMKRELEIVQGSVDEAMKSLQDLMKETDPKNHTQMRFDVAKETLEKAMGNLKELSELTQKSNEEAFTILNKRALESFDEVKDALNKINNTAGKS
ncbi:MAG: TIGR01841 family phasin [Alphaproteobacteria bacterium]|jgi:phasin family protein|nr:TIGR01841 family phasin [Alphaproteobacteria bacterium]